MASNQTGKSSKLFIRSEVLAVIALLSHASGNPEIASEAHDIDKAPNRLERAKQIKRLAKIEPRQALLDILLKELPRSAEHRPTLQVVCELLMELGDLQHLKTPLWDMIKSLETTDDVKDAANLTLRQLGDASDPDLYLTYLHDPEELITRETERMLGVSASNPEALIDFLDFLFSLPAAEQQNLIQSLHADYPTDELLNLYMAALLADPLPELAVVMLKNVSQIRSPRAAKFLMATEHFFTTHPKLQEGHIQEDLSRLWRLAEKTFRLQGINTPNACQLPALETITFIESAVSPSSSENATCFITLPDILGNQGVLIGRAHGNDDMMLFCVAMNDVSGIVDAFGFQQLSRDDYERIVGKFQEESSKIEIPLETCRTLLQSAEERNWQSHHPLPYEYTCWKSLFSGSDNDPNLKHGLFNKISDWYKPDWQACTQQLSQFPDFSKWFLDEFDSPILEKTARSVEALLNEATHEGWPLSRASQALDEMTQALSQTLLKSTSPHTTSSSRDVPEVLINRLALSAYLLSLQGSMTFAQLAATEALRLHQALDKTTEEAIAQNGHFFYWICQRSIEECLLKYRLQPKIPANIVENINALLKTPWPSMPPALT
ncbi:MAG: hypothetical protein VKK59_07575 [Vampirovibrionales bacterium]|nr:hypothetical protein [Vampirovibrionales bacterium]